ncbi:hypothetical protein OsJ_29912 [Oryza sativa Japonica Group]|uniref:Enoyl reductase (ER) domain-containing protein n=1 Tax=Oryza sativa subsp. japonica TaxID=39947 RepID=A3C0D1_ORYSJ|nr:hypothetical protein OsJ_29912 [Oryza sativa Japonica Group]
MATSSRRMRAVQYDKYGGGAQALKHVEVPIPTPKKGEVLIKMEAGSINQVDWKFQKGVARPFMPNKFPFIPVYDLAGEVVELGRGVSSFKVGDKVIAINFPGGGGLAEYAVAQASRTTPRPPEVSAAVGACLPIAAVTALVALRTAGTSSIRRCHKYGRAWQLLSQIAPDSLFSVAERYPSYENEAQSVRNFCNRFHLWARAMATSSRRMRAVQYDKYGGGAQALKHVEVPIPTPKKGEVLIKMEAGSINQVDWKFQKGVARPFMPNKFPFIPVYDLAGEVVELGRGVSSFKVGDKVIAINFPGRGAAEPLGGGGTTPWCTARRWRGLPWSAFAPVLADAGVVVDLTPGAAAFATALRQRVTFSRKRLVPLFVSPTKEDMELVAGMVAEGKLRAVIESRHPLSRAEEGWARSMAGHATGKIIVEMGDEQ